eukprot:2327469-Rhodomonas_salina.2
MHLWRLMRDLAGLRLEVQTRTGTDKTEDRSSSVEGTCSRDSHPLSATLVAYEKGIPLPTTCYEIPGTDIPICLHALFAISCTDAGALPMESWLNAVTAIGPHLSCLLILVIDYTYPVY